MCFHLKGMCIICVYKNPQIAIIECNDRTAYILLFSRTRNKLRLEEQVFLNEFLRV
jgi:hypothetical protein